MVVVGDVPLPVVLSVPFLNCFLCFMRLFWNQVFTWVSDKFKAFASSTRSGVER